MLLEPAAAVDRTLLSALAPGAGFEEALAAWMLGRPSADAAQDVSAARQRRWRDALVLSNGESELLAAILANVPRIPAHWTKADRAGRKRIAASDGFRGALALLRAAGHPIAGAVETDLPALEREGLRPPPFVTGDDLVALGLRPGPAFRPLLDRAYDLQLNGAVADRESALAAVRSLVPGA